ncbi:MAG: NADH-quinone oxidoreductase subunit J [Acidobacteriia bacterium]|nr:NADH-quinone oxidoreductase subunit J [Terriglobia bacterium]
MELVLFFILAIIAVGAAINMVVQKHPIHSALSLIVVMGTLSLFYVMLHAEFLAVVQVIVYAGAIMVLFVFVIMLLNPHAAEHTTRYGTILKFGGVPLGLLLLAEIVVVVQRSVGAARPASALAGTTEAVGRLLFTEYLIPFEFISVVILVAILGAVVLTKREL